MKKVDGKKIVLVTGGAGYIGSHTLLQLLKTTDYEVVSIDNYINSYPATFEYLKQITGKTIVNHELDLCDKNEINKALGQYKDRVAGIIHFAALKSVPESTRKPLLYYKNNIDSLANILEFAEENGCRSVLFSSSCSVYGNVASLPVNENTPLQKAESPYAHTKQIGEDMLRVFSAISTVRTMALRYFNPVGADDSAGIGENPRDGMVNNLVPAITQTAAGIKEKLYVFGGDYATRDGSCVRDYIHVNDIARAHVLGLQYLIEEKSDKTYDVFNLGSGNGVTVLEAIKSFEKNSGVALAYEVKERRAGDVEAIYSDSSKAKNVLGWEPQYTLDDMMKTAWEWQKHLLNSAVYGK